MASFTLSPPAVQKDLAKMPPSRKSFFEDSEKPNAFGTIDDWNSIRDFLYTFGLPHRHKVQVAGRKVEFTDIRALSFVIATKMNLLQEDYATRLSAVGNQGRLVVEAFCLIFAPDGGFGDGEKEVGIKLSDLKLRPELKSTVESCKRVNELCIGEVHIGVRSLQEGEKAEVVNLIFSIVTFVKDYFFQKYPSEASNAVIDSRQLSYLNASRGAATSWGLGDEDVFIYPTEVHIWLETIGFEQSFARKLAGRYGFKDMETMQNFQESIEDPEIKDIIKAVFPKLGDAMKFKTQLKKITPEVVSDIQTKTRTAIQQLQDAERAEYLLLQEEGARYLAAEEAAAAEAAAAAERARIKAVLESAKEAAAAERDRNDPRRLQLTRDIREFRFSLLQLFEKGYTIQEIESAGFRLKDLNTPLADARALKKTGKISVDQLRLILNYEDRQIFTVNEMKLQGLNLNQLKSIVGFPIRELKDAGYSLNQLKEAGSTVRELNDAFDRIKMKDAGYSLTQLKEAGCTVIELKGDFGFIALGTAGFSIRELRAAGCVPKVGKYEVLPLRISNTGKDLDGFYLPIELQYDDMDFNDPYDCNGRPIYQLKGHSNVILNYHGSNWKICSGYLSHSSYRLQTDDCSIETLPQAFDGSYWTGAKDYVSVKVCDWDGNLL